MRAARKLTDTQLRKSAPKDGMLSDGNGLYLRTRGDSRMWLFVFFVSKRRREMSLGSYPNVTLSLARELAQEAREKIARGLDPIIERKRAAPPMMRIVAEEFIALHEAVWSPKVAQHYRSFITLHMRALNAMTVDKVDTYAIKETLLPLWGTPTGQYLRSFIERAIDYAVASGYRADGPNPARYRGHLALIMPKVQIASGHHEALPWSDIPSAYASIAAVGSIAAKALCFMILNGMRQSEARELRWMDVAGDRIVIPADQYKTRREHVLPITGASRAILDDIRAMYPDAAEADFIFPGQRPGQPLSHMAFNHVMRKADIGGTIHGFRTSLAVWAVEAGGFSDDTAQRVLGHLVGTAVTRAYQRSLFIDQKRDLLDAWAAHVCG